VFTPPMSLSNKLCGAVYMAAGVVTKCRTCTPSFPGGEILS
jgi:hypothetical protein